MEDSISWSLLTLWEPPTSHCCVKKRLHLCPFFFMQQQSISLSLHDTQACGRSAKAMHWPKPFRTDITNRVLNACIFVCASLHTYQLLKVHTIIYNHIHYVSSVFRADLQTICLFDDQMMSRCPEFAYGSINANGLQNRRLHHSLPNGFEVCYPRRVLKDTSLQESFAEATI